MVQTIRIEAASRERAGKGAARATRRGGMVPAVIYGAKQESTLLSLDPRDVMKEMHKGGWQSHLYEVGVKDGTTERCLMREVQFHPVTDQPMHVDFQRLAPGVRIRVKVAVVLVGEADSPGIKAGGVANLVRRDLEVMADPDNVPERFEIDLSEANMGDTLRWSNIRDHGGATSTLGRDFVVVTVAAPTVEEEVVAPVVAAPAPAPAKGKGGKAAAAPAAPAAAAAKAPAKKK